MSSLETGKGFGRLVTKGNLLLVVAFGLGLFHLLVVSGVIAISTLPMRIIHVAMAFAILFAIKPTSARLQGTRLDRAISAVFILVLLAASWWLLTRWKPIAFSGGLTVPGDFYAGLVLLIVTFEAARRGIGLVLAGIAAIFVSYAFFAPFLPGVLNGRGVGLNRLVIFLTTDTSGIYGIPIGVSATYIIVFTIFGALLSRFGAGDFFFEISLRLTRGMRAAGAKSSVMFSALIGMVSGSAAGNVAVTGVVTIPMMKREGFKPHQAAAIEAIASTGGQIMPPVMGAAAFIMAEIVGVPYTSIMTLAVVPAILFFVSAFFIVHLQAVRLGIAPSATTKAPDERPLGSVLWQGLPFIGAFAALLGLMLAGYSPFKASLWAMLILIGLDVVVRCRIDLDLLTRITGSIAEGARGVVTIAAACAAAGVIAGTLGITGLGSKIAILIETASGGYLLLALVLTMVASIILGMGLPTTAAYLVLATVVAPALVKLGVPVLHAHFFVFFYGCISTITPPVALAAYVAGGIADADINKTGWVAAFYAITSFALPFALIHAPALMFQGSLPEIAVAIVTGIVGMGAVAVGVVGCLTRKIPLPLRLIALAAGACLLFQGWISALIGVALMTVVIACDRRAMQSREV